MSSPQPRSRPASAARSVARAKQNPTNANLADAMSDMHSVMVEVQGAVATLKGDVGKLLHHFGLVSGEMP